MGTGDMKSLRESRATPKPSRNYEIALSNGSRTHVRANHVFVFDGAATFTNEGGFVAAFSPGNWRHIRHVVEQPSSDAEKDVAYFEKKLSDAVGRGDTVASTLINKQLNLLEDAMAKYNVAKTEIQTMRVQTAKKLRAFVEDRWILKQIFDYYCPKHMIEDEDCPQILDYHFAGKHLTEKLK